MIRLDVDEGSNGALHFISILSSSCYRFGDCVRMIFRGVLDWKFFHRIPGDLWWKVRFSSFPVEIWSISGGVVLPSVETNGGGPRGSVFLTSLDLNNWEWIPCVRLFCRSIKDIQNLELVKRNLACVWYSVLWFLEHFLMIVDIDIVHYS